MPKFHKKPVEIEAILHTQMDHDDTGPFPVFQTDPTGWLTDAMERPDGADGEVFWDDDGLKIRTLEGVHLARPGDWILRGVQGEIYPCKPDIFAATYDVVEA